MDINQVERGSIKIGAQLKKLGIYTLFPRYNYYQDKRGEFINHRLDLLKLKQYYTEQKKTVMVENTELLIWFETLCVLFNNDLQKDFYIQFTAPRRALMISMLKCYLDNWEYDRAEMNRSLEHIRQKGYETDIKRVQVKMAVSTEAAKRELQALINKIKADVKPSLVIIQTDLDLEVNGVFQDHREQLEEEARYD